MKSNINKHQLKHIIGYIQKEYKIFATQKIDGKIFFDELVSAENIEIKTPKTTIPFKKILWPDGRSFDENISEKIAFIGLTNCDAIALDRFLKEFSHTNLLAKKENILVISTECQPDQNCFCTAFGNNKIEFFDLHIQKEKNGFSIFSGSKKGEKILKDTGIKNSLMPMLRKISLKDQFKFDQKELTKAINDKKTFTDFWQKIANNCFGCGACSSVCPLCFCTKQDFVNTSDGNCKKCLKWDSCFAKNFSEIQNHYDFRPENKDRLYNWYHHKLVRAYNDKKHFLCTGCGRCIKACPAHLNQYRIMKSIENKEEEYDSK